MDIALFALKAALLDRWSKGLKEYSVSSVNWSQIDSFPAENLILIHWQSATQDQRDEALLWAASRKIIVLTDMPDLVEGRSLILNGIRGYANSYIHETLLPSVVDEVSTGNVWAVPELLQAILRNFLNVNQQAFQTEYDISQLSEREAEVYQALMIGSANKEIARSLGITERTVKAHVAAILKKTGSPDRVHLIVHGKV